MTTQGDATPGQRDVAKIAEDIISLLLVGFHSDKLEGRDPSVTLSTATAAITATLQHAFDEFRRDADTRKDSGPVLTGDRRLTYIPAHDQEAALVAKHALAAVPPQPKPVEDKPFSVKGVETFCPIHRRVTRHDLTPQGWLCQEWETHQQPPQPTPGGEMKQVGPGLKCFDFTLGKQPPTRTWTSALPDKDGWWWARRRGVEKAFIVEIISKNDELYMTDVGRDGEDEILTTYLGHGFKWYGPLDSPPQE